MTCGFGFRRCGACSLARDCPSQHKMMTHKGANCMPRTCGRKNRKSFNGMCCRLHVPRAAGHAEACPDPFFYCTLNVPQASMHTGTGHAAGCPLAGMSVKDFSLTSLSHSGTFFFCHSTNLFVAGHPFGQNLPSLCTSNPNEIVDFLICLTSSTKNCLSNT